MSCPDMQFLVKLGSLLGGGGGGGGGGIGRGPTEDQVVLPIDHILGQSIQLFNQRS